MHIGNIFHRQRKTEPLIIHILRVFIILTSLMLILLYSTILIFNIYSDTPVLRNSSRQEPYISAPGTAVYSNIMLLILLYVTNY